MEEQFVLFDTAFSLKEKGFLYDCLGFYYYDGSLQKHKLIYNESSDEYWTSINAPLYQQVVDWFAGLYHLDIETIMNWRWKDENEDEAIRVYSYVILKQIGTRIEHLSGKTGVFKTKREAIENHTKRN